MLIIFYTLQENFEGVLIKIGLKGVFFIYSKTNIKMAVFNLFSNHTFRLGHVDK